MHVKARKSSTYEQNTLIKATTKKKVFFPLQFNKQNETKHKQQTTTAATAKISEKGTKTKRRRRKETTSGEQKMEKKKNLEKS